MTEIFRYKSGPEDMIVLRHQDNSLTRNGLGIYFTRTGRKYVELSYSRRKQYLCKIENCFKNTFKEGACREHSN